MASPQLQSRARRRRQAWRVPRPRNRRPHSTPRRPWLAWLLAGLLFIAACYRFPWQSWLYPKSYPSLVGRAAARHGVPASLVWAVIRQESNFQRRAVSPVGARGLMQLMPETASWVDAHLEGGPPRRLDLEDPETNIRLGVAYLAYLYRRFPGDPVAVIAAYNAGPEPIMDWLEQGRRARLRLEDIGYPETRAYVEKVLRNQQNYRRLYPELQLEGRDP